MWICTSSDLTAMVRTSFSKPQLNRILEKFGGILYGPYSLSKF